MLRTDNVESCIINSLKLLRDEVLESYLPKEVTVLNELPDPFEFCRDWVTPNIPLLIKGGIKNWPALKKWNKDYLCKTLKDKKISVAVTPNGYADAITEKVIDGEKIELFVLPEERFMTISDFFEKLDYHLECSGSSVKTNEGVFYIQKQNSNLTEEFTELLPDIDQHLTWASKTFNSKPAAINLWIGDERAITSLHKDPFENIYCVVSGHKDFILLPPTDRPWLPYKTVSVGQYKETNPGTFEVIKLKSSSWKLKNISDDEVTLDESSNEENQVPWIAVDPYFPDYVKYPLYKYASPIKVRVEEGDMFYLPSLWFHHVKQSHKCIAVNYWYDMVIDIKYAYFQLIENLTKNFISIDS